MKKLNIQEIAEFINDQSESTKVYVGCDSERIRLGDKFVVDYTTVVVVHIDGNKGCKVFGEITREPDFDTKKNRPKIRLMQETYKVADLYLRLQELIFSEIEIHLDINPDEMAGSNCAINEAVGYIRGVCNVIPFVKPEAWAASTAADRYKSIKFAK